MKRHSARPATPGGLAGELAEVEKATGWHTWIGVAGIFYARLARSSPPRVVRAKSPADLNAAIAEDVHQHRPHRRTPTPPIRSGSI
jgi:hypothetical protein